MGDTLLRRENIIKLWSMALPRQFCYDKAQADMECLRCQGNDDNCSGQAGSLVHSRSAGGQCETEETHLDAQKSMLSVENRQAIYLVSEGIRHGGQMCVR